MLTEEQKQAIQEEKERERRQAEFWKNENRREKELKLIKEKREKELELRKATAKMVGHYTIKNSNLKNHWLLVAEKEAELRGIKFSK